jgi:hypothetical protein
LDVLVVRQFLDVDPGNLGDGDHPRPLVVRCAAR